MKISAKDRASLISIIERFPTQSIIVMGDLIADEYIHGEISRVSREAPVLILKQREKKILPGGGANAANNLAELGARVTLAGVVGEDEIGNALISIFKQKGVETRWVSRHPEYSTPTKSRVLGGLGHGHMQQIVRIDREPSAPVPPRLRRDLSRNVLLLLRAASGLLVSDYGFGATNARELDFMRLRISRSLPVTIDSRHGLLTYSHVTAATPNEPELEAAFQKRIGSDLELLHGLGLKVLTRQSLKALLVTRGKEGIVLFEPRRAPLHLPIFGSDQVADVTGAGDTVIAVFTLALAAKASYAHAAMLANCAGGLVVMKSGTATVSARELTEALRNA
ncbi:MAG TPA: PfkB family carbohydrate kinase [Terriglobia bacterium]|nr:PfkB family carbohydrate kinase [Terriglobia bacterium]